MIDIKKYQVPVPRYTSYPTVPFWDTTSFSIEGYARTLSTTYWESSREVSVYIHLPFCESLCTYCACNTRITKNHAVEEPYIEHLLKEWNMYLDQLPDRPVIREIHLGGGTPTFFTPDNLGRLIEGILEGSSVSNETHMSFEGHPGNTTSEHLEILYNLGFRRVSFGIQDFDEQVQKLINRIQSFEQVRLITAKAREIGYESVNYDIVYGLPSQHLCSLNNTLDKVLELSPDRIAFYSYAHVPKMRPAQKSFESFLPNEDEKYVLMLHGKNRILGHGYKEVGMDHFVKPEDELMKAQQSGRLHRNFMGYTPSSSRLLIGLGVSAISDTWSGFAQNEKKVEDYYDRIESGHLPIAKGHLLTREDLFIRQQILNLMCKFKTIWTEMDMLVYGLSINFSLLDQLQAEGLLVINRNGIEVPPDGKPLIRVICSAFDVRLNAIGRISQFSRAI